ncbi:MAG: biotin/lipoyl-containing protein, partial [Gammaproteobacteria bacterium]|nr:biotin/lipoyl-containing protein [Gammaproteobacteria bacterium]
MTIEIKAPTLPESVPDGTIATWHKKAGEAVKRDELLVDIETDKVVIEVVSPADGVLAQIIKKSGDTIVSNELIATIEAGASTSAGKSPGEKEIEPVAIDNAATDEPMLSPAAKKIAEENGISIDSLKGSGKNGRVTKEDVLEFVNKAKSPVAVADMSNDAAKRVDMSSGRVEERVPMSRLRAKVAERLLQASQSTAMLTTFNEVDMAPVMAMRNKYKDMFEKTHDGVRLGFMSFFVRASIEALKRFPAVNASI